MYAESRVMLGKHSALDSSMGGEATASVPQYSAGLVAENKAGLQQMRCKLKWDLLARRRRLVDSVAGRGSCFGCQELLDHHDQMTAESFESDYRF